MKQLRILQHRLIINSWKVGQQRSLSKKIDRKGQHAAVREAAFNEIIEKWGRKPFYNTCGILGVASAASLVSGSYQLFLGIALPSTLFAFVGIRDINQSQHTICRNFPVIGHIRFLLESIRPEIRQYFVESDQEAYPFSRENRAIAYAKAKGGDSTVPFGTLRNVYDSNFESVQHSMYQTSLCSDCRVSIGSKDGGIYDSSLFNVSAMSFGAISPNAILALNDAAKRGGFSHNTGEGGISKYHLENGGDIVWNIGTGYFGARNPNSAKVSLDREVFKVKAALPQVKMIEIKLSQGAKPGKGGILPGPKVNKMIAETRGVPEGLDCKSPTSHSEFKTPEELLLFAQELRHLSGKPVGIKLCVGKPIEFAQLVKKMVEMNLYLDFITVDGSEGGTGA